MDARYGEPTLRRVKTEQSFRAKYSFFSERPVHLIRVHSQPTLGTNRNDEIQATTLSRMLLSVPSVHAELVRESLSTSRVNLSIVIKRSAVRHTISIDTAVFKLLLFVLFFILASTATGFVVNGRPGAVTRSHTPVVRAAVHGDHAALVSPALPPLGLQLAEEAPLFHQALSTSLRARVSLIRFCLAAESKMSASAPTKLAHQVMSRVSHGMCSMLFPTAFAAVSEWHSQHATRARAELEAARTQLHTALVGLLPMGSFSVEARLKSSHSLFEKVFMRGKIPNDLLALRVIIEDSFAEPQAMSGCVACCHAVHTLAASLWHEARFKDLITYPKPNGYQSLHVQVELPTGSPMELQIRTRCMHQVAEHGSAAHALYKMNTGFQVHYRHSQDRGRDYSQS